jgi:ribosomal protein L3 glutamine methyltransferase
MGIAISGAAPAMGYTWGMSYVNQSSDQPETVGEAIHYCHQALEASDAVYGHGTDNAWDESVQLVLSVADLPLYSDEGVMPHRLEASTREAILHLLRRRIDERVPLPYLLGRAWFAGLEFRCDKRAIIPRSPMAELIMNDFLPWYSGPDPKRLLDLCCGGGSIGLAAAHYQPGCSVDLADIDSQALALAAENRSLLGLEARANLIQSDLLDAVEPCHYDLILSNPPYVDASDLAQMPREFSHEPAMALAAGEDGLDLVRRILAAAGDYLADHGLLIVEVGNSWEALEAAYPRVPFTWIEFEAGGHGVFAITAAELQDYAESFSI